MERRASAKRLADGVRDYEMAMLQTPTAKHAKCKRCQQQVYAPKRLCEKCAKSSALKSKRQWWAKTRKNRALGALITNDL
jgi:hypothetical protein